MRFDRFVIMDSLINVMPAQAGIPNSLKRLDARFRGHDDLGFCSAIP
jgi:hypothetical protein